MAKRSERNNIITPIFVSSTLHEIREKALRYRSSFYNLQLHFHASAGVHTRVCSHPSTRMLANRQLKVQIKTTDLIGERHAASNLIYHIYYP